MQEIPLLLKNKIMENLENPLSNRQKIILKETKSIMMKKLKTI